MKTIGPRIGLLALALFGLSGAVSAVGTTVSVYLKNGDGYTGKVVSTNAAGISMQLDNGHTIFVPFIKIESPQFEVPQPKPAQPERDVALEQFLGGLFLERDLDKVEILNLYEKDAFIRHGQETRRIATNQLPDKVYLKAVQHAAEVDAEARQRTNAALEKQRVENLRQYNLAVDLGYIRSVNGQAYDLRNPSPDWVMFSNALVRDVDEEKGLYLMEDRGRRMASEATDSTWASRTATGDGTTRTYPPSTGSRSAGTAILFFLKMEGAGRTLVAGDTYTVRALKVGRDTAPAKTVGQTRVQVSSVRRIDNSRTNVSASEGVFYNGTVEDAKTIPVYDAGLVVSHAR